MSSAHGDLTLLTVLAVGAALVVLVVLAVPRRRGVLWEFRALDVDVGGDAVEPGGQAPGAAAEQGLQESGIWAAMAFLRAGIATLPAAPRP
ncbi:hypothetical protein AB0H18_25610 [Streptomyces sp. NPDC020766]|uniref:hypothetical protein n=1 Tax=Streptomyces sp. NPDC020766 TaxID=3155011 RepID=UPI0033D74FAC